MSIASAEHSAILVDIRQLIERARQRAAAAVNTELTLLYWHIGKRLQNEVLVGERAEYGKQIVTTLSKQLTSEYGKGWSECQLWLCLKMTNTFPNSEIVNTVCAELSWSHLLDFADTNSGKNPTESQCKLIPFVLIPFVVSLSNYERNQRWSN